MASSGSSLSVKATHITPKCEASHFKGSKFTEAISGRFSIGGSCFKISSWFRVCAPFFRTKPAIAWSQAASTFACEPIPNRCSESSASVVESELTSTTLAAQTPSTSAAARIMCSVSARFWRSATLTLADDSFFC